MSGRLTGQHWTRDLARQHASAVALLNALRKQPPVVGRHVLHAAAVAAISTGGKHSWSGKKHVSTTARAHSSRLQRRAASGTEFGALNRRCTDILLVLNALCFGAQLLSKNSLMMWGAKINSAITAGQYWRLITPVFLHANVMHLAINCYSLNNIGPAAERWFGPRRFAAVYGVSTVAGMVASYIATPHPAVGASGAIFGIVGALAVFLQRNHDVFGASGDRIVRSLAQSMLLNFAFGAMTPSVDNWGHLGGLVGGAAASYLLL